MTPSLPHPPPPPLAEEQSGWERRVYQRLLQLYPRWFHNLYAQQMLDDFDELLRVAGSRRSPIAITKCWATLLGDLAVSVPREHFNAARRVRPNVPPSQPSNRWRGSMMTSLLHDLRYAFRTLRQHLGFSAMVVATLALGIGANIAMFTVVNGVLLSPLPYRDADRLVMVWNRHVTTGSNKVQVSGPDFVDYGERGSSFEAFIAIHNTINNALTGDGPAEPVEVAFVTGNFFQFLGREPVLGRSFTKDDELTTMGENAPSPVVITHGLWARRYGSDPGIIGRTIHRNGVPMEIVGVLPADFEFVMPDHDGGGTGGGTADIVDVWHPLPQRAFEAPRAVSIFRVIGRLREGVTFGQAQREMDAIAAQLRDEHRVHEDRNMQIDVVPMHADVVAKARPVVLSLLGAVGFVLLIACANVANLILVRVTDRRREVAVRAALGANRVRLIRLMLTENTMLAVAATALGLLLASVAIDVIVALAPSNVPFIEEIGIGPRVAWFTIGLAGIAVLLFGLLPAVRASQPDLRNQLSEGSRSSASAHRIRNGIVIAEIAVSLVLLVGGGLMIRSFRELQRARLGFEPASVLTMKISLPRGQYAEESQRANYWSSLRREVNRLTGVDSAAIVWPLPFAGRGSDVPYAADGGDSNEWGRYIASVSSASPGYFEAMGARVLDGRTFTEADLVANAEIAVIDDIIADRLFAGSNAVGRTLWLQRGSSERRPLEIVGVVEHIRHESVMGLERETIFIPTGGSMNMAMVVRTQGDPRAIASGIRRIAASLDPNVPLFDVRTFDEYLENEIAPTRFTMTLASVFAGVALVLASVGLYGVISYTVAQRASELGLRKALGAQHGGILRLVLGHGLSLAGAGIGVGVVGALVLTRTVRGLLFGITATDPVTFVGVSLLLLGVTLAASYVPARRAARVDPMIALRRE